MIINFINKYSTEVILVILSLVLIAFGINNKKLMQQLHNEKCNYIALQNENLKLKAQLVLTPEYLDLLVCSHAKRLAEHEGRLDAIEQAEDNTSHKFSALSNDDKLRPFVLCVAQDGSWYSTLDSLIYVGITKDILNAAYRGAVR